MKNMQNNDRRWQTGSTGRALSGRNHAGQNRTIPLFLGILGLLFLPTLLQAQSTADLAKIALDNSEYGKAVTLFHEALKSDDENFELLTGAGDAYMALEKYDSARIMYERAFREESKDGAINRKLGTALSQLGRHDEAIVKLRRSYKYDDESIESRLALGDAYLRMGNDSLSKAELAILGAKQAFSDDARVYIALGDLYYQRGVYELSESNYFKAIELDSSLIQSRIQLAISYRELGRRGGSDLERTRTYYENAFKLFKEVTDMAPFEPIPWRQLGEILLLTEDYENAIAAFNRYKKLRPDDADADLLIGITAAEAKAWEYTMEPARIILAADDDRSKRFHGQARTWLARGSYALGQKKKKANETDSARYYYMQSAAAFANAPDSLLEAQDVVFLGNAHFWAGDTTQGVAAWSGLLDRYPDSCRLAFQLAGTLFKYKRYEDAATALDKIESRCENPDSRLPMMRALSFVRMKDMDRGIPALEKTIASDSTNVNAYFWLTRVYSQQDRQDEILALAPAVERNLAVVEGVEPDPELAWVHYFIGVAHYKGKAYDEAIAAFDKATDIKADHSQAYLYKGVVYHTLKDKDGACENYRKTLQHDPDNETATKNLKGLGC